MCERSNTKLSLSLSLFCLSSRLVRMIKNVSCVFFGQEEEEEEEEEGDF